MHTHTHTHAASLYLSLSHSLVLFLFPTLFPVSRSLSICDCVINARQLINNITQKWLPLPLPHVCVCVCVCSCIYSILHITYLAMRRLPEIVASFVRATFVNNLFNKTPTDFPLHSQTHTHSYIQAHTHPHTHTGTRTSNDAEVFAKSCRQKKLLN